MDENKTKKTLYMRKYMAENYKNNSEKMCRIKNIQRLFIQHPDLKGTEEHNFHNDYFYEVCKIKELYQKLPIESKKKLLIDLGKIDLI